MMINLDKAYQAELAKLELINEFPEPDFDDVGESEPDLPEGWLDRRKSAMATFGLSSGHPCTERVCWLADEGLVDHPDAKSFVFKALNQPHRDDYLKVSKAPSNLGRFKVSLICGGAYSAEVLDDSGFPEKVEYFNFRSEVDSYLAENWKTQARYSNEVIRDFFIK